MQPLINSLCQVLRWRQNSFTSALTLWFSQVTCSSLLRETYILLRCCKALDRHGLWRNSSFRLQIWPTVKRFSLTNVTTILSCLAASFLPWSNWTWWGPSVEINSWSADSETTRLSSSPKSLCHHTKSPHRSPSKLAFIHTIFRSISILSSHLSIGLPRYFFAFWFSG